MQYEINQLKRQQLIMSCLGFYTGAIDGLWGPKSIDGKKRFEGSPKYLPALPSNGMPFASRAPFPNGISIGRDGLLYHDAIAGVLAKEQHQPSQAKASTANLPSIITPVVPDAAAAAAALVVKEVKADTTTSKPSK